MSKSIVTQILEAGLTPPPAMYNYSNTQLVKICNGCGAADSWLNYIIPEGYDDVEFIAACYIHDFDYYMGDCLQDKVNADAAFLANLIMLCNMDYEVGRKRLCSRHGRAYLYFSMVDRFGHKAFVAGRGIKLETAEIIKSLPEPEVVNGVGDTY